MSHVFVSYSTKDRAYALKVAEKLRAEGFDVWIDNARLGSSEDWWRSIVLAIWNCSAFVVILTPQSDISEWVQLEITIAANKQKPRYPLLLEGDLNTVNWQIFARTQYEDVRGGKLPPPDFFDELARHAPRKSEPGIDVTAKADKADDSDPALQAIIQSPPKTPDAVKRRSLSAIKAVGLAFFAVLVAVVMLISYSSKLTRDAVTPEVTAEINSAPSATPAANLQGTFFAQPLRDGVMVRDSCDGERMGIVNRDDKLEIFIDDMALVGAGSQCVRVYFGADRQTGYITADRLALLQDTSIPLGVAIDYRFAAGFPDAELLGSIEWVRFIYNISYNPKDGSYGNADLDLAFENYLPIIQHYGQAGYKVMLVITYQTFGEGAGYVWSDMEAEDWGSLTTALSATAGDIAAQYEPYNLVSAYQIWQEPDSMPNTPFAVTVPPPEYARMFTEIYRKIRAADSDVPIITGGMISANPSYVRSMLDALPADVRPDGIAIHAYGRSGSAGELYGTFGMVGPLIDSYRAAAPDIPIWITEWGVWDRQTDPAEDIQAYAEDFVTVLNRDYGDVVQAAIWYGWTDGMFESFGLVDSESIPREPLYSWFTEQ